jgi:nucleoside-diphosphate-sugar epimerase
LKVLVTGGAGFIGSNIAREAAKRGFEVTALDNLYVGSLNNLKNVSKLKFIKGDIRNAETVDKVTRDVDYIFHEGAVSSSQMFVPDPREGMEINLQGFLNVLYYALKNGVKKVVYAMTSSMYGNTPVPWKEENIALKHCPNAYAYSLLSRSFFSKLYSDYGLGTVGLVYFSVYGPYEEAKGKYANIVSQFLWSMMKNEQPLLYGDGNQSRDFVYVDDVVEANFLAAESDLSGEIVNVGTGTSITMKTIVNLLNKYLGKNKEAKYAPNPIEGYVYHTLADATKADRTLGFKAKTSIEDGLRLLVDFYRRKRFEITPE